MVSFSSIAKFGVLSLASAGAAPQVSNSPTDVEYMATFNKTVSGHVEFSAPNGTVSVLVHLTNLPSTGGPFTYHIHEAVVPASGNCTATLGHFNPYNGSTTATTPQNKEVGDLSGKHGSINGTSFHATYFDPYLSLNTSNKAYFANLSVVIHYANSSRLACTNILKMATNSSSSSSSSTATATKSATASAGAGKLAAAGLPLVAGVAALLI